MKHEEYAALPGLNWSSLEPLMVSPLLCEYRSRVPREETEALRIGRYLHVAALEPERWAREFTIEPDFGPQQTKAGKLAVNPKLTEGWKVARSDWLATLPTGVAVVDAEEHVLVTRMADALHSHRVSAPLLSGGRAEFPIQWTDEATGISMKARLDLARVQLVLDVKTTMCPTVRQFLAQSASLGYDAKMAMYQAGAIAAKAVPPNPENPILVTVQKTEPHDVVCYRLPTETLEAGMQRWRSLVTRWQECSASGFWPGLNPGPDPLYLDLPGWAVQDEQESEAW